MRASTAIAAVACLLLVAQPVVVTAVSNTGCIVCTILLGLVDQWLGDGVSSVDLTPVLNVGAVCNGDPSCERLLSEHGNTLVSAVMEAKNPDDACADLKLCTNTTCRLWTNWPVTPQGPRPSPKPWTPPSSDDAVTRVVQMATIVGRLADAGPAVDQFGTDFYSLGRSVLAAALADPSKPVGAEDPCGLNVTCIIHRVFDQHLPFLDADGDSHTGSGDGIFADGFRGADWRGRDCNDSDPTIYPGRKTSSHGPDVDHNCNGIVGTDPSSGKTYEELYCEGTDQRGVVIIGDSAAAHFHIPPAWLRGKDWNLDHLLTAGVDELDWPQCSWSTGFKNTTDCPASSMPMNSVYQRMRSRNRCAHRDFQNVGVNGARSTSLAPPGIITSLQRDQANDQPLLLFYAPIGNDVCNGHPGMGHMTTVSEFTTAVTKTMEYLDTVLPAGSSVVFIPLVDGRVLWDTMHDQIHPLGVPYPSVYNYLSCSGNNPCWGWLNSNETWRNLTTQRAQQLSAVYPRIIANQTYKHFDMHYQPVDWNAYIKTYVDAGGTATDLIEPVDGLASHAMEGVDSDGACTALDIPTRRYSVPVVVALGYAAPDADTATRSPRLPPGDMVRLDSFSAPFDDLEGL